MRAATSVLLGTVLALCGCDPAQPPAGDAADPGAPERIVSLSPALTEILFALDLGSRVVGVTDYCDHPPEARRRARVGGYVNPSVEAVLALEPDLVLVSPNTGNRDAALAMRRAGARLEVVPAENLADTYDAIETVARLAGVEPRGDRLIASIRARIAAATEATRSRDPVTVLFCLQLEPIVAAGAATLPAELLTLAGGRNVLELEGYPRLGIESVIEDAPSVILHSRMDVSEPGADARTVEFWKRWPSIPAVRDGRVHVIDGSAALRPGPRVADAVEQLVRLLHPEPSAAAAAR